MSNQMKTIAWLGYSIRDGHLDFSTSEPVPSVIRDFNMQPLVSRSDAEKVITQQAVRIAGLEKEVEWLKTVPMKYRRMAFNAQLQEEILKLQAKVVELENELAVVNPFAKEAEKCLPKFNE